MNGKSRVYIYVDESGDLGIKGTTYFIMALLVTSTPRSIEKIIRKVRKNILKKKYKKSIEIKANKSNKRVREYVLSKLKNKNIELYSFVVNKNKLLKEVIYGGPSFKEKFYRFITLNIIKKALGRSNHNQVMIYLDKKYTQKKHIKSFYHYLSSKLKDEFGTKVEFKISQEDSFNQKCLQVVDFVAWAIGRKYNFGDEYYFNIIKEKLNNIEVMEK